MDNYLDDENPEKRNLEIKKSIIVEQAQAIFEVSCKNYEFEFIIEQALENIKNS